MSFSLNVSTIPLALYIHIPWCVKKCPYCDFNSHTLPKSMAAVTNDVNHQYLPTNLQQRPLHNLGFNNQDPSKSDSIQEDLFATYVNALIKDIDVQLPFVQNRCITSIFIGGGTPSLLPITQYQRLFAHLRQVLPLANDIEVTMEANPGTLEHVPFEQYLEVGINRLSIGVQSFADDKLQALGRIHNSSQAVTAIAAARRAGFKRINVDLMHGLPQQTTDEALADIQLAHDAGATHLSWYQLTIEPNTVFYRDTPILPDEDNLGEIEEKGSALLRLLGYQNYEISAWVGENDDPCQHNINYWQFGDYLAIGAGAHGKVSIQGLDEYTAGVYRFSKSRAPKDYMAFELGSGKTSATAPKMIGFNHIDPDDMTSEFMLNGLRLTQGVDAQLYQQRTGKSLNQITPILNDLKNRGLLVDDDAVIRPTELGRRYLNQILQAFL